MSAILSSCGKYRYTLRRPTFGSVAGDCCFVMLNPSTADATQDDPTIRRCVGFAKALGCVGLEVVNLFAYRSTNPDVLAAMSRDEAVGEENDQYIWRAAAPASFVICAWGNHGSLFGRDKEVLRLIRSCGAKPMALKINAKSGQPAHPLYLKGDARPLEISP